MKLMIDDVKALWTCGDEKLEKSANNIITALEGKAQRELLGDQTGTVIDKWLIHNDHHVLCKNIITFIGILLLSNLSNMSQLKKGDFYWFFTSKVVVWQRAYHISINCSFSWFVIFI